MEAVVEEAPPSPPPSNNVNNKDLSAAIAKGKRTKRHRPHSPIPFTIPPPAPLPHPTPPIFSPVSSEESTTTEDEDTARCLLLLSRGGCFPPAAQPQGKAKRYADGRAKPTAVGACMYTCKTCNRAFSSFQALGGHRASHKKPKNEKKLLSAMFLSDEEDFPSPSLSSSKNRMLSSSLSLQLSNMSSTTISATPKSSPSPRMHECSYCGAEFTSGQALGGHMRRHRGGPIGPLTNPINTIVRSIATAEEAENEESKLPRSGLSLDLNLPAPEDENQKFGLEARERKSPEESPKKEAGVRQEMSSTTAPPLVDWHY